MKQGARPSLSVGTVVRRAGHLLSATVGRDVVLLDPIANYYYDTDSIGAEIWGMLEQSTTVKSLVEALVRRYDVAPEVCEADVLRFLEDAAAEGLIEVSASAD